MKTASSVAAIALAAAAYSVVHAQSTCDTSAIQGKLYPNATEMMNNCDINVFELSEFPTQDEIDTVVKNTDCVNYINQIFQVANVLIYNCTIMIEGETVVFGELITEFLEGKTGNESESASGSTISVSDSGSGSVSTSSSESSSAGDGSKALSSASGSASNVTTTSLAASTTMSSIAAGCVAILSVSLML